MLPIKPTKAGYTSLFLLTLTLATALTEGGLTIWNLCPHHFPELLFFYVFGIYLAESKYPANRVSFLYSSMIVVFLLVTGQLFNSAMILFAVMLSMGLPVGYAVERWYTKRKG